MKTSIIEKHNFFEGSLVKLGLLSNAYRSRSPKFLSQFENWLKENETILKQYGYIEATTFSMYQNQLFSFKLKDVPQKRKKLMLFSGELLNNAHDTLMQLQHPFRTKIEQGKELIGQLLTAIEDNKEFAKKKGERFDAYVKRVWAGLRKVDQFHPITLQIRTLLPEVDIFRFIAEIIKL